MARKCGVRPPKRGACAVVDEAPGRGYVVALFDASTSALKGFLSVKDGTCDSVRERSAGTTFPTVREAEAAAAKCRAKECPP